MEIKKMFKTIGTFTDEHSSEIFLGLGVAGTITAVIFTAVNAPKAAKALEEAQEQKGDEKLTVGEKVKVTWKYYLPTVITEALSIVCFGNSLRIGSKRSAALATALAISDTALKNYSEKVIEVIGEKKEIAARTLVDKDKLIANPLSSTEVIVTKKGNTLCYDTISGRYFTSDIEKINKIVNDINRDLRDEMYIPLNEFYYRLGLDGIKAGDLLGWNIEKGYLEVKFTSQLAEDGTPALVIDYVVAPKYNYT